MSNSDPEGKMFELFHRRTLKTNRMLYRTLWKTALLPLLLSVCCAPLLHGAEPLPVLLLGHGSDTWKAGKILADHRIVSKTMPNWPSPDIYSAYSVVYIGDSLQEITKDAWSEKTLTQVAAFVENGGTLIFSGDTAFQLAGGKKQLPAGFAELLGFGCFVDLKPERITGTQIPCGVLSGTAIPGAKNTGWTRHATLGADRLSSGKAIAFFNDGGRRIAAATENQYGKGRVYFIAPTLHRVAGNGEIPLGNPDRNGKWVLNEQGRSSEILFCFFLSLVEKNAAIRRSPAQLPVLVSGGDSAKIELSALKQGRVAFQVSFGWVPVSEYKKYALVYLGETFHYEKKNHSWLAPDDLKTVREYLENGGVIVTSGGIPRELSAEKDDMGTLAPLFGFAGLPHVKNSTLGDFIFTSGELRKKALIESAIQDWRDYVFVLPRNITTAQVLGEFQTASGNVPALTVNRVGRGRVYWLPTNPYKLLAKWRNGLGEPNENGVFILNKRGRAADDLQRLFVYLFSTPENVAPKKEFPEKKQWGLIPLGAPGNLPSPSAFRNPVVYKKPVTPPDAFPLSENGVARAVIVAPADGRLDHLAADLRDGLRAITGGQFPVVRTVPEKTNAIVLFDENNAKDFSIDLDGAGPDTAIARTAGQTLLIGGKGLGGRLALSYFFEKLGCRRLWPGRSGRVVPRRPTLAAPRLALRSVPALSSRCIRFGRILSPSFIRGAAHAGVDLKQYAASVQEEEKEFFRWHGIVPIGEQRKDFVWGISFNKQNNIYTRCGKTHPEYFALQSDGSRSQDASPGRYRLCHSNPGVIRQVAADCIAALKAKPGAKVVCIPLTDGGQPTFCMCAECRKLDPVNAEPRKIPFTIYMTCQPMNYVALTDRVLAFSNAVAGIVNAEYPDVKLYMYCYSHYSPAPVKVKPHPALFPLLATMEYTSAAERCEGLRHMMKYASFPSHYIWGTCAIWGFKDTLAPQNFARNIFEDMEAFKANSVVMTDFDAFESHWAFKTLVYYAVIKSQWNPDRLDYEAVFHDFCERGFGAAAPRVREFFSLLEATMEAAARANGGRGGDYHDFFDEKVIASLRNILAEARRDAQGDSEVTARLDFLSIGVDGGELTRKLFVARKEGRSAEYAGLLTEFRNFIARTAARDPFALGPEYAGTYSRFLTAY